MAENAISARASVDLSDKTCTLYGAFSLDPSGAGPGQPLVSWNLVFSGPGSGPESTRSGIDSVTTSTSVQFDLDTAPGVAQGTFSISAKFVSGTGSVSGSYAVFDAALEQQNRVIFGTGGMDIVLGGAGADSIVSGNGDDLLYGGAGADTLRSGDGDDELSGGGGTDTLFGGTGDDVFHVAGSDKVYEKTGEGIDRVSAATSYVLQDGQEVEILDAADSEFLAPVKLFGNDRAQTIIGTLGNNVLEGRGGNDVLRGESGDDTLRGGLGDDRLEGGPGNNVLTGGAGKDSFQFDFKPSSFQHERITDFSVADDTLRLNLSAFPGLKTKGVLSPDAFKDLGAPGAVVDGTDRVIYDSRSGVLAYDVDGRGAKDAVTIAILDHDPMLTHADILIV